MPITKNEDTKKTMSSDAGIAVVRRNTEEVQSRGNFEVFEELFAADFVDHTPQPGGFTPDRDGARNLYRALRAAFPDFHAEIHWQISDGDRVTTYKTYHGTPSAAAPQPNRQEDVHHEGHEKSRSSEFEIRNPSCPS
jgi:hypothetical protein